MRHPDAPIAVRSDAAAGGPGRHRFEGQSAIVTGAGAGIGKAIAIGLAAEGAQVLAVGRSGTVTDTARETNGVVAYRCDISDPGQVSSLEAHAQQIFNGVDVFVANAAVATQTNPMHEVSLESLDQGIATNIRGTFLSLQVALRLMLSSGGGSIVVVGSLGGLRPAPNASAYGMTKAATHAMARHAAFEYASHQIRVNTVAPGATDSALLEQAGAELREHVANTIPLGRIATPEQVARVALFLASSEADHVTGQIWGVDGGAAVAI